MPTGYTAPVADGTVVDLKTFALKCARAMGACIMMRDDPFDKLPPRRFEPQVEYHTNRLTEAQRALAQFESMNGIDRRAAYSLDVAKRASDDEKYRAMCADRIGRYRAMYAKVEAWQGAPDGLKEFMLEQLAGSINWDDHSDRPGYEAPAFEKWQADRLASLHHDIEYSSKSIAEEIERTQSRNEWLEQLWSSLEEPEVIS